MATIYEKWKGHPLDAKVFCEDIEGNRLTPIFSGCIDLYNWLKVNGWKQGSNWEHGNDKYQKGLAVYIK